MGKGETVTEKKKKVKKKKVIICKSKLNLPLVKSISKFIMLYFGAAFVKKKKKKSNHFLNVPLNLFLAILPPILIKRNTKEQIMFD